MALDTKIPLSDTLRKALLVASKSNLNDFRKWIKNELDGYADISELPDYRFITVELKAQNPYHGLIPFVLSSQKINDFLNRYPMVEPISSYETCISENSRPYFFLSISADLEANLIGIQNSFAPLPPKIIGSSNKMHSIVNGARNRLIDMLLELERQGINVEGIMFTEEKTKKDSSTQINISGPVGNIQGILGSVTESSVTQNFETSNILKGDFESLAGFLKQKGIDNRDIKSLEKLLKEERNPISAEGHFCSPVSKWISRMAGKALEGIWQIPQAVAVPLLTESIKKFFGL